jgi:hypothetical protein
MTAKEKAAGVRSRAASILHCKVNSIRNALWLLDYSLEEARQRYAGRRQMLRQAAACIAIALLQLVGVRYA